MSGKKSKIEREISQKTWQHMRREHAAEWNKKLWDKLVDDLFLMPFRARFGFAWRLITGSNAKTD